MPTLSPSNFMTLSGPIYLELREQLIAGVFELGQRLKLNELAEQTGTSVAGAPTTRNIAILVKARVKPWLCFKFFIASLLPKSGMRRCHQL